MMMVGMLVLTRFQDNKIQKGKVMKIKIETYNWYKYDDIHKEYGDVLNKFGLTKTDDEVAYIDVNSLEDLFEIDKDISSLLDERDDWYVYFGIVIKHDGKEPFLEIKDNYD